MGDNEPGIRPRYFFGFRNIGADFLSRPVMCAGERHSVQLTPYVVGASKDSRIQVGLQTGSATDLAETERVWGSDIHLGHPGVEHTWHNAQERGLKVSKTQVEERVKKCRTCMSFGGAHKIKMKHPPIEVIGPGSLLVCDVLGPHSKSKKGSQYVLVAVEALTRVNEHYLMRGCCSSEIIAKLDQ